MRYVAGIAGLLIALAFGTFVLTEVLILQDTGEAEGGNLGTLMESMGPIVLIFLVVLFVGTIGAVVTWAVRQR